MELKQVLQKLKESWRLVVVFGVIGLFIAGGYLFLRPHPIYEARALFFVTRTAQEPQDDYYAYDGFHAQQTAYHYTDTLVGLAREFKASKVVRKSEQLVQVALVGKDIGEPELLDLTAKLAQTFEELSLAGDPAVKLVEVAGSREVTAVTANIILTLLVGILGGLGVGLFAIAIKEYLN
ncbi:MAG: hypothetical protein ABH814_01040 [bacterium]